MGINSFNERIKEINEIYKKKNEIYINEINSYKMKLSEYKRRIILLKRKIDELYIIREPQVISLFNYDRNYGYQNQIDDYQFKRNLTPNRIGNKNYISANKRKEKEGFLKNNIEEKESLLQNEQKKFLENYTNYLSNLKNYE